MDTGEGLEAFLPTGVDPKKVLDVLGVKVHVPSDEPEGNEEISAMAGGGISVSPSKRRMQKESKLVDQVLDYLLEKLELS